MTRNNECDALGVLEAHSFRRILGGDDELSGWSVSGLSSFLAVCKARRNERQATDASPLKQ